MSNVRREMRAPAKNAHCACAMIFMDTLWEGVMHAFILYFFYRWTFSFRFNAIIWLIVRARVPRLIFIHFFFLEKIIVEKGINLCQFKKVYCQLWAQRFLIKMLFEDSQFELHLQKKHAHFQMFTLPFFAIRAIFSSTEEWKWSESTSH